MTPPSLPGADYPRHSPPSPPSPLPPASRPPARVGYLDDTTRLGDRVDLWHFSVVLAYCDLADDVSIGARAEIGAGSVIGHGSRIGSGVFLPPRSRIGCSVFIGPNATFTDDRWPIAGNRHYKAQPPVIDDFAAIGAGAVILPGVRIGAHAVVGAGAVVARDVPPHTVVYAAADIRSRPREAHESRERLLGLGH